MLWEFYNKQLNYFVDSKWDIDIKRKYRQTAGITFFSGILAISCLLLAIYYKLPIITILQIANISATIYVLSLLKSRKLKFAQNFSIYYFEIQIFITAVLFSTHFSNSFVWSYALLLTIIYPVVAALFDLNIFKHIVISLLHLIGFQVLYYIFPQIYFLNIDLLEQNNLLLIKLTSFVYLFLYNTIIIYLIYKEQFIAKEKVLKISNTLIQKNEKIEQLNYTKDKLFSIISHDLRSPFNSIIGFSDLLVESDGLNNKDKKYSEIINKSSKGALSLIDNLLYWSKSQLKAIEPNFKIHCLSQIINDVISSLQNTALQKNVLLINNVNEKEEAFVDSNLIQIILRNLIANSIKFSNNASHISINASIYCKDYIKISVEDQGIGIDSNNIDKLFHENYTQPGTNNEKGSGLGLSLCKEFVKLHKGKIWVDSKIEKGTTVNFTIPLNVSSIN